MMLRPSLVTHARETTTPLQAAGSLPSLLSRTQAVSGAGETTVYYRIA